MYKRLWACLALYGGPTELVRRVRRAEVGGCMDN